MKYTFRLLFVLLSITSTCCIQSCKEKEPCQEPRNPECENYNPCIDFVKTSADFTIQEDLVMEYNTQTGQNISCDTVLAGNDVYFTAKQNFESYTWRIIGDPNFERTGKQFKIWFDRPMNLQVQLIGKRKPNIQCDPFDTGIDTFTRRLVVFYSDKSLLVGTFEGIEISEPNNSFSFTISAKTSQTDPDFNYSWHTSNFPNGCGFDLIESDASKLPFPSYKLMYIDLWNTSSCQSPTGWFMAEGNKMIVNYTIKHDWRAEPVVYVKKQFIGQRK